MPRNELMPMNKVIAPDSIAVIGATANYQKFGGRILHHLVEFGFAGKIYPINPKRETVLDIPCFPAIEEVPAAPDIALVAVPGSALTQTIEACGRAGVGACIVVTAQTAEFSAEGAEIERQVVEVARKYNMRIVGPNCMGMIMPATDMALTSTPTLRYAGFLRKGNVAFVSQSGALMGSLFVQAHDHGVGLSGMVSIGNQADLELCDFLEAFLERQDTDIVCLYIEGLKSAERFRALALHARKIGKRIIAVKAGRTEAGSKMARSHTSSLAGSYSAFETLCRETGVLLVDDPDSMILCAGVMAGNPRNTADSVGVVCGSGGGGAILADRLTIANIPVTDYTPQTRERLARDFPLSHQNNPLDLGAHKGGLEFGVFGRAMEAIYEDPDVGIYVYVLTPQPLMPETVDLIIQLWQRQEKPLVLVLNTSRFGEDLRQKLLDAGLPFVTRSDDLMRTLNLMVADRQAATTMRLDQPARPANLPKVKTKQTGFLTEPAAKAIMAEYGVNIPAANSAKTLDACLSLANEMGYPVVMKGVVPDIVHKSDLGLVKPGLPDAAAVSKAFGEISAAIKKAAPEAEIIIDMQQMIAPGVELIVGLTRDIDFGPQLIIGSGGIYVELLKDIVQKSAPASASEVEHMLRSLRIWPLLDGERGQAKLDIKDACEVISRLSWLAHDLGDQLIDFEINPFRLTPSGNYALDGRGTLAPCDT